MNAPQTVAARANAPGQPPAKRKKRLTRTWWLRQLHNWHWISAAVSLICLCLFALTGVTLNHSESISATPVVTDRKATLPAPLLATLKATPPAADAPLPAPVAEQVRALTGLDPAGRPGEWSDGEVYVALPRPGGDAWVTIDRASGAISSEVTNRGWISYLNDLHKGRNTGQAWKWFIDLFAAACFVFTITGLLLLQFLARNRPLTWPLVGLGLAVPLLLALIFIH